MRNLIRSAFRSIACGLLLAGCAATTTTQSLKVEVEVLDALNRYEGAYLLQAGDQIEVFVYRHAEFSRKAVIRPDGYISVPLLGDVKAAGRSPRELSEDLVKRFSERIKNPEVTVMVENPPEPMVFVLGDVGGPRALPLRQAKTVAQALALSGNVVKSGDASSVAIVRLNGQGVLEAHTVTSDGFNQPETYMALQTMALKPNDLVFVPEGYRGQLVRMITDVNTVLAPYYQFRVLREITN